MSLSSVSIKRPVLATVMSITIVVFGILGYSYLGVREYPSVDPPVITVSTAYSGANADVIESQITEPLEKSINGIDGIRTLSSTSALGVSTITVEFNLGADLETAANDVRDKVAQAIKQLPVDIDAPPGVSAIQVWGQKKYAMRLWLDPKKLSSYGLTSLDVETALTNQNVELPAGKIEGNTTELTVRTLGRLYTEDDFNNLIIKSEGDNTVKLKDVGYALLGSEIEETMLKESGVPMIGLGLVPQPGANYIDIANEFYKRLDKIKQDLPQDLKVNIALDDTRFVKKSVSEVKETLLIAFALVVIIIFLFFRDALIAFRPLIDIPVSLIGAFFIMYICGFSINVLTLLAIVLATGLVVDDGIVVTENIYKKVEQGMSVREAAFKGSNEIFFAVVSTSLTLAAVFLPIVFLQGFTGRLFREFGIVVAGAVLISAFVSLSLTPMLNVKLIRKNQKRTKFYEKTEPFFEAMISGYNRALDKFLNRRWLSMVFILVAALVIFFIGKLLPSELAPLDDRNLLRISATAPEGSSYEFMNNYMDSLTHFVKDSVPEASIVLTVTAPGFSGSGAVNTGIARIMLKPADERKRTQQQIADFISSHLKNIPGARAFVVQEQTISVGTSAKTSLPVQFVLQAESFDKLQKYLPKFMEEVNKDPTFLGTDVNLKFNKPELIVNIDRPKAKELGVSVLDIAHTLQLAFSGSRFGYFTIAGKQYQVIGQFDRANRDEPIDLKSIYVRNQAGSLIQLDNVVKVKEQSSPPQLYHFNRYESATVSAGLAPGKTVGDGINAMKGIAKKTLDNTFTTDLYGASRDYAESSGNIVFAFLLALGLIYLVLAAQFESFIDPLIIMLTVPLALAGALLTLWYFGQTLNIFSEIGIIVLIGLVTKNGILIVEFANQQREHGFEKRAAVLEAATSRLRPILMTSLATVLGALPIALALGAGSKSRAPMGIAIIGGLLFALLLTLFVIPAIYTYLSPKKFTIIDDNEDEKLLAKPDHVNDAVEHIAKLN